MSDSTALVVARRLEAAGAGIIVTVEAEGGGRMLPLPAGEVDEFLAQPDAWTARQWGVTAEQLEDWRRHEHMPQCGGVTKGGQRCRNRLASDTDPDRFVQLHGSLCRVHGG